MIEVKNIQKAFVSGTQQVQVAKGLSFQIKRGEFVSIVGPSGSGKSTLLHMLGGLDVPDAGSIVVEGQEITTFGSKALAKYRAHTTGFVFQAFHLEPLYTVYDNVRVALMIARVEDGLHKKKIQEALEQVGMLQKIHTRVSKLSGGEKQRVAIARAIVHNPSIILADEPCGNLDSANTEKIMDLLVDLNKQGKTIVLVTHSEEDAGKTKRTITLRDGEIESDEIRIPD